MPESCTKITVAQALKWAVDELRSSGKDEAVAESEFLLTHILQVKRHKLYLEPDRELTPAQCSVLKSFVKRRLANEPVQYITGETEFHGLTIKLNRATLIPRPETEILVDEAKKAAMGIASPLIIDLCTGSGCIAIAVAWEIPTSRVIATDIIPGAIQLCRENARINNVADRITCVQGDLFKPLNALDIGHKADIMLANPPYISEEDYANTLAPEVKDFEPRTALYGGPDGGEFIRKIIDGAPQFLKPGGILLMEFGYDQAQMVEEAISHMSDYDMHMIAKDLYEVDRVLKARTRR